MRDREAAIVVIDGVHVAKPSPLSPEEINELARYNGRVQEGVVHDAATVERMKQLRLRCDWFGWLDEHKKLHPAKLACAGLWIAV